MPRQFSVGVPSDTEIVAEICRALAAAGFRVVPSFDLQSARDRFPDCACPRHGTALCDCQYRVLLVYGRTAAPAALILYGHDARYWISFTDGADPAPGYDLMPEIVRALADARLMSTDQCVSATAADTAP